MLNISSVSNKLFHISDWLPTLLSSAGIEYDRSDFDGVDQWSDFTNDNEVPVRTQLLVNIDPVESWSGIIKDDFKLVRKTIRDHMDDWLNMANTETNLTDQTYVQLVMQSDVYRAIDSRLTETEILEKVGKSIVRCPKPPNVDSLQNCGSSKTVCLFNIAADPCEFNDIADEQTEVVQKMSKLLRHYLKVMVPPLNQPRDDKSDTIFHNMTWVSWNDLNTHCNKAL